MSDRAAAFAEHLRLYRKSDPWPRLCDQGEARLSFTREWKMKLEQLLPVVFCMLTACAGPGRQVRAFPMGEGFSPGVLGSAFSTDSSIDIDPDSKENLRPPHVAVAPLLVTDVELLVTPGDMNRLELGEESVLPILTEAIEPAIGAYGHFQIVEPDAPIEASSGPTHPPGGLCVDVMLVDVFKTSTQRQGESGASSPDGSMNNSYDLRDSELTCVVKVKFKERTGSSWVSIASEQAQGKVRRTSGSSVLSGSTSDGAGNSSNVADLGEVSRADLSDAIMAGIRGATVLSLPEIEEHLGRDGGSDPSHDAGP